MTGIPVETTCEECVLVVVNAAFRTTKAVVVEVVAPPLGAVDPDPALAPPLGAVGHPRALALDRVPPPGAVNYASCLRSLHIRSPRKCILTCKSLLPI